MRRRKARRVVRRDSVMNVTPPRRSLVFLWRPRVVGASVWVVVIGWDAVSGVDGDEGLLVWRVRSEVDVVLGEVDGEGEGD